MKHMNQNKDLTIETYFTSIRPDADHFIWKSDVTIEDLTEIENYVMDCKETSI